MHNLVFKRAGCALHAWLDGPARAPVVVFTHGAWADHRMFTPQIAELRARYRCLSWDVRGHGRSRPMGTLLTMAEAIDDLTALLAYVGVERAALVGQSMGGNLSQAFVARFSERVDALVLIDCASNAFPLTRAERWVLRWTPTLTRLYPRAWLLRQSARASSVKPPVQAYLSETFSTLSNTELALILGATVGALQPDPSYRSPVPFLLLRGAHDTTGAIARQAPLWAAKDPGCRYVVVPDAGHAANMDNPAFVNAALRRWLDTQGERAAQHEGS